MTTITINGQPVEATRVDELHQTVLHQRDHYVPAMRDGITVRLSVAQILSLLERADLQNILFAEDVAVAVDTGSPLVAETVQAAIEEMLAVMVGSFPQSFLPAAATQARANIDALGPSETPDRAFRRGNVIGTVSQSGGIPTGALVEAGSNANGTFRRFAGGWQICAHAVNEDAVAWTTATGSLFVRTSNLSWTFPSGYATTEGLTVTGIIVRNQVIATGLHAMSYSTSSTNVRPWSSISLSGSDSKTLLLLSSGKWHT